MGQIGVYITPSDAGLLYMILKKENKYRKSLQNNKFLIGFGCSAFAGPYP